MAPFNVSTRAGISQLWTFLSGCIVSYDCCLHPIDFCAECEMDTVLGAGYRENHSSLKLWSPDIYIMPILESPTKCLRETNYGRKGAFILSHDERKKPLFYLSVWSNAVHHGKEDVRGVWGGWHIPSTVRKLRGMNVGAQRVFSLFLRCVFLLNI